MIYPTRLNSIEAFYTVRDGHMPLGFENEVLVQVNWDQLDPTQARQLVYHDRVLQEYESLIKERSDSYETTCYGEYQNLCWDASGYMRDNRSSKRYLAKSETSHGGKFSSSHDDFSVHKPAFYEEMGVRLFIALSAALVSSIGLFAYFSGLLKRSRVEVLIAPLEEVIQ